MTYVFHPEAHLEYKEAAIFYESRQPGLGAAFTLEVEAAIDRILEAPGTLATYRARRTQMSNTHFPLWHSLHNRTRIHSHSFCHAPPPQAGLLAEQTL